MATTLKLGDSKWATKNGSLLAYNDENGNFKPLPFNFTRDTGGTVVNKDGLIEMVSNNVPRIDFSNDANGALLLEPQRSNLILKSDDVLTTYQSQNGTVSDANTPINGFNNSIQIDYDASNSLIYKRDFTPTIGTEYTISCFVQMSDNSAPIHTVDVNSGDFCLINNNTLVSESDIKTERLGSTNVYKVSAKKTAIDTNNRFGIIKYATQSSKGFKVTGFQLEQGSYATSYIPTQGATATRVAETCNNAGNVNTFNDSEGVLFAEISALVNGDTTKQISLSDGTLNNRIVFGYPSAGGSIYFEIRNAGTAIAFVSVPVSNVVEISKIAVKYKNNDFALWINGIEVATDNSGILPTGLNRLAFDNGNATGGQFYGNCKDLRVYTTALSDSELQALTQI